ncbi:hypothetical protein SAMN05216456_3472 [Devosia crocina]|uniref:Uncharacterized protein n=1 Tax=Devosia crocina TaxID=429728 RepID=A0A1I7NV45_9HYPH|nr:hypothetical protein [Devosia crocina]SFV38510.1 hypothetical protein SAMN05216456_3472 [Devosia crocina]
MTQLRSAILVLSALGLGALPAWAQIRTTPPLVEANGMFELDALGHRLSMPLPDWLSAGTGPAMERVEANFLADEGQALLEIYPEGESEALWTTLYGARISHDERERTLADYRAALMMLHANSCKPELTGFFQLGPDDGDKLAPLGFVCGAYQDQYTSYRGLGEVMVASFRRSDTGVAIIYQEWRGKAFNPADPNSWPVSTSIVEARAAQLQSQVSLSKAD